MFQLLIINDIASWRYNGRTTCVGNFRSENGARKALRDRLRTHSLCASAYEIKAIAA
jgi:hypothetical protein